MDFKLISELSDGLQEFQNDLLICPSISLDIETTGLDPISDRVLLIQAKLNNNIYLFDTTSLGDRQTKYILSLINSGKLCKLHNAKFDLKFIYYNYGELLTNIHDTFISEIICTNGLSPNRYPSFSSLTKKYFDIELEKDTRKKFIDYDGVLTQDMLVYSAMDVNYLDEITKIQLEEINKSRQEKIYDLEMRLLPVVGVMELNGIKFDPLAWNRLLENAALISKQTEIDFLNSLIERLDFDKFNNAFEIANTFQFPVKTKKLTKELTLLDDHSMFKDYFAENFKTTSPNQVLAALNIFGFDLKSTEASYLKAFREDPTVKILLEFREAEKKVSTYGDNFSQFINPITGKVHANYHQFGAASGRFSCEKPNLQNIPRQEEYRNCFLADDGCVILATDYSQQEYRLAGALSGDPAIIEAYLNDSDIHSLTAEITGKTRDTAKNINFSMIYGVSAWGLARKFEIPVNDAQNLIDNVFSVYSTLKFYKDVFEEKVLELKFSVTPMGRRRYFQDKKLFVDSRDYGKYIGTLRREGFNHPIQGGGADITKLAMCDIFYNNPFGDDFKILMQVHDEIVCMVKDNIKNDARDYVEQKMLEAEAPFLDPIPAKVESKISKFWSKG